MEQKQSKVRLLCSYGGQIKSRPSDHQLAYVGGETKIVAVDRAVKFSEFVAKLNSLSNRNDGGGEISVKYQLPGEALDSLVSLIDDDDVEHMIVEYDRMQRIAPNPAARLRLRIFVFNIAAPVPPPQPVASPRASNPDYLFGFDKEYQPSEGTAVDLLPISSNILPENGGRLQNFNTNKAAKANPPAGQGVYRVPVVANGGVYGTGAYFPYGNREQPVYKIVPIMPIGAGNDDGLDGEYRRSVEVNADPRNF